MDWFVTLNCTRTTSGHSQAQTSRDKCLAYGALTQSIAIRTSQDCPNPLQTHARTHSRTHARTHARTHTHTHTHARTHSRTHTHTHTHARTHTHTHAIGGAIIKEFSLSDSLHLSDYFHSVCKTLSVLCLFL